MPKIIMEYCNETGQSSPETSAEITRFVYESLALRFRYDLEILKKLTGKKMELLRLIGGGTQNKLLC